MQETEAPAAAAALTEVDDRALALRLVHRLEQRELRREVRLGVAVVQGEVARLLLEARPHGDVGVDALEPAARERLGRGLDDGGGRAAVARAGEDLLHAQRVKVAGVVDGVLALLVLVLLLLLLL